MTEKEIEKIKTISVAGQFMFFHLVEHHNFSEKQTADYLATISARLYTKDKEMTEKIKKDFPSLIG